MIWIAPILVLAGVIAGPILADLKPEYLRRWLGWGVLAAIVTMADQLFIGSDPILRMVVICSVLLGGMKGLVYAEWAGNEKLSLPRYLVFALLWFGMDPASFRNRREGLSWKQDVILGVFLMLLGTLGAWAVWAMELRQILVMFIPMSVGFHFGALRVLKGMLRTAGYPVRTLFPNLLTTTGVGDFWSKRWNVGYSQMMQRLIGRPVEKIAGANAGIMAVFLVSGLLHELAITLPVRSGFGFPTLYFTLHGVLVIFEKRCAQNFGKIPTLLAVMLPLGFLFPPDFQAEIIARCLGIFDFILHR